MRDRKNPPPPHPSGRVAPAPDRRPQALSCRRTARVPTVLPRQRPDPHPPNWTTDTLNWPTGIGDNALGTRNVIVLVAAWPTAHMFAHLRVAGCVTETGARLATDPGGLTPGRAGFAPAGRQTKSHEVIACFTPLRPALPGRTDSPIRFRQRAAAGDAAPRSTVAAAQIDRARRSGDARRDHPGLVYAVYAEQDPHEHESHPTRRSLHLERLPA